MNIYEKLLRVQVELKAPKGQYNSFGKYKYRSCEDILTAVKPLLEKVKATITISDELVLVGDRFYIKATASFIDTDTNLGTTIENTAFAREDENKKGIDGSQITGTASSYARKYALNGLLLIDDTKDTDTDENHNERKAKAEKAEKEPAEDRTGQPAYPSRDEMVGVIAKAYPEGKVRETLLMAMHAKTLEEMSEAAVKAVYNKVVSKKK